MDWESGTDISCLPRKTRSSSRRLVGGGGVHYNNWRIAAPVAKFRGAARAMGPVDKTKREQGERQSEREGETEVCI